MGAQQASRPVPTDAFSESSESSIPALICELCRVFYGLGWVSGTGGGISIRGPKGIYMAPSGVQKERIKPEDVFLLDGRVLDHASVLRAPSNSKLRISECRPLFYNAFRLRGAGAVMQPLIGWLLDSNWDGTMQAGARIYSAGNYSTAFLSLLVVNAAALVGAMLLRETRCQQLA